MAGIWWTYYEEKERVLQKNLEKLFRYTSLPILLDMLIKKKITLLSPSSWEDRNDSFFVEKYREKKHLKTVLAMCFTTKRETFHHWKVFAGNSSGVCVRFDAEKLIACLDSQRGVKKGHVVYRRMRDLQLDPPSFEELPFIKRLQYEDEAEYRIIYEDNRKVLGTKDFLIDLDCIERITLSPWLPISVAKTVKKVIRQMPDCSSLDLIRTGVVENKAWKNIANKLE